MACDDELTMMPKKLTRENPSGTLMSCGRPAAAGVRARDAKSGAFLQSQSHVSMKDGIERAGI